MPTAFLRAHFIGTIAALFALMMIPALSAQDQPLITTVVGNGSNGFSGDGGSATAAKVDYPMDVAVDAQGNYYFADYFNSCVRKVDGNGIITTVAGQGHPNGHGGIWTPVSSGDGGSATAADIESPVSVALDGQGDLYILDSNGERLRKVDGNGVITTVAGTGSASYNGDGISATAASLSLPQGMTVDAAGDIYIADTFAYRVRRIDAATGIITTVAGDGTGTISGDGGSATAAGMTPCDVVVDAQGDLYIADFPNHCVRKVDANGIITAIAGPGDAADIGDGGPATAAYLSMPEHLALDPAGNLYIADDGNDRVRRIDAGGTITTVVGNGTPGGGDGGPAVDAGTFPFGIAFDANWNLYICDDGTYVRKVDFDITPPVVTFMFTQNATKLIYDTTPQTVAIVGLASDDVGVTAVSYAMTGATVGTGDLPYSAAGIYNWSFQPTCNPGTTTVTVTASDAAGNSATSAIAVIIEAEPAPVIIDSTVSATVGSYVDFFIPLETPQNNYTDTADPIPPGLHFDHVFSDIYGIPTATGTYVVNLSVSDSAGSDTGTVTFVVVPATPVVSSATTTATVGDAFSYGIISTSQVDTYGAAPLPPGLSFDATSGQLYGTPTATGTTVVTLTATNATATATGALTLTVGGGVIDVDTGWNAIGSGQGFDNSAIWGMDANGADLYVAGYLDSVDGVVASGIAHWDGAAWSPLGSGFDGGSGERIVFNGSQLCTTGKFNSAGGVPASNTAIWDGSSWTALGAGVPSYPYAATVVDGAFYAGGGYSNGSGNFIPWVSQWNGSAWVNIATGTDGWVYSLCPYGHDLVISGDCTFPGFGNLGQWNGSTVTAIGGGVDGNISYVISHGSDLYVAGRFTHAGGIPVRNIARWDGSQWHALGAGLDDMALGLTVDSQGGLYAVGGFTHSGLAPMNGVAYWNGMAWSALGSGLDGGGYTTVATDAGIAVCGPFAHAGQKAMGGIALWNAGGSASPGTITTSTDAAVHGTLHASDALGVPAAVTIMAPPLHGSVVIDDAASGAYTYSPAPGYAGGDRFSFRAALTDSFTNTADVSVTVADISPPQLAITTPAHPSATIADDAAVQVTVIGTVSDDVGVTALTYALTGATANSGSITVAPTWTFAPSVNPGTTVITITASDAAGNTSTAQATIVVQPTTPPPPPSPVITSGDFSATVGSAVTYAITASNAPTAYGATGLPPGLTVDAGTGAITGVPTASGTYFATISATNAGGTGSAAITVSVLPVLPVPSDASLSATVGVAFTFTIVSTGAPTEFSTSGLPRGLVLNAITGVIAGTPSEAGITAVTVTASNAAGTGSATVTIIVHPAVPVITSGGTATVTGTVVTYQITASGNPTSFSASGLPAGMTVDGETGLITGTPAAGTYTVTVSATNESGTGSATVTIQIDAPTTATAGAATGTATGATTGSASGGGCGIGAGLTAVVMALAGLRRRVLRRK